MPQLSCLIAIYKSLLRYDLYPVNTNQLIMRQLLLAVVIITSLPVAGQERSTRSISPETKDHKKTVTTRFGFKGGFNRSHIKGVETDGDRTGYIGGELYGAFFGDTRLNETLSLGYEFLFSWTDDYHFVEIPLHLKYNFYDKWSAFAGPKLDILVDNDGDAGGNYQFKTFGVSAELGVQYNITRAFFAETRYAKSFTEQVTDFVLDINNGKRNTFRIGLGIRF